MERGWSREGRGGSLDDFRVCSFKLKTMVGGSCLRGLVACVRGLQLLQSSDKEQVQF